MKTYIPACIALAMAFIATTAYGQYVQQPRRTVAPQQNWAAPIVRASTRQEPALTVQSNATPMQSTYNNVVGSDCGCADPCGGQCGGRTRVRDRLMGGQGNDCNPCGPERYLSFFGGAATFNDIGFNVNTVDAAGAPTNVSAILNQNNGWTVGGGIGRRIRQRLRGEIEWSYRNATLNTAEVVVNNNVLANANLDGELNVYRSTTNLLFDVNPGGRFNAYFGGGVGVGFVDIDAQEPTTPIAARLQTSSFVYQGIVGVSARVNPRVEMFVDYRYSGTDKLELDAASPAGTLDFDVDITSNDIFVGFRIKR